MNKVTTAVTKKDTRDSSTPDHVDRDPSAQEKTLRFSLRTWECVGGLGYVAWITEFGPPSPISAVWATSEKEMYDAVETRLKAFHRDPQSALRFTEPPFEQLGEFLRLVGSPGVAVGAVLASLLANAKSSEISLKISPAGVDISIHMKDFLDAQEYFDENFAELLAEYGGEFVAIIERKVVANSSRLEDVTDQVYREFEQRPIFIKKVEAPRVIQEPSIRAHAKRPQ